jgi:acylphosphatase
MHRWLLALVVVLLLAPPAARAQVTVQGWVQAVFFRASVVEEAGRLGLKGWVRNLPDGSVELVAEGGKKKIEQMIRRCPQGPPGARVEDVQVRWEKHQATFEQFSVKR